MIEYSNEAAAFGKHAMIALFGALVHALMLYRDGKSKGPLDILLLTVISSFSGIIFALIAMYLWPNAEYATMAAAGSGGYLGTEGMSIITGRIREFISGYGKNNGGKD